MGDIRPKQRCRTKEMQHSRADSVIKTFFAAEEYESISPRSLVDSADLKEDLWLDELAMMELQSYVSEEVPEAQIDWNTIETLGDLKKCIDPASADGGERVAGRTRWMIRVQDWNPSPEEFERVPH